MSGTVQRSDHLVRGTRDGAWTPAAPGVETQLLAAPDGQDRYATSLFRLAPGAALPPPSGGLEVLVLDGDWRVSEGALRAGDHARLPAVDDDPASTASGCTLLVKTAEFAADETRVVHARLDDEPWLPGHGNLRVKPLHTHGTESSALVHWPAGERFLPHTHWGGEEIFVLSGTFLDEHGRYPTGTWLRSPHMSAHHPFVEEETVIFVKTGHLRPVS